MFSLITPTIEYQGLSLQNTYRAYINELGDEERYPYPMDLAHEDFDALVDLLNDYSKGQNLPRWLVPNTTFWLMQNTEIVACSHLRHSLNKQLEEAGGHIGLGVRPSYRGKGIAKILLMETLKQAKLKNINKVHIHCYASNDKSLALIKSVGASLQNREFSEKTNEELLKFIYRVK